MVSHDFKLGAVQILRVVIGLMLPLVLLLSGFIGDSVDAFYFPQTYDPQLYWKFILVIVLPVTGFSIFFTSWRFQSIKIGLLMLVVEIVFVVIFVYLISMLL